MSSLAARRRARGGFSMVELMVTVVLAAIIFSAMVPMFLSAETKASGDRVREMALTLAQSRIDQIRQLNFAQVAAGGAALGTQLGTTWTSNNGTSTKVFTIAYSVSNLNGSSTGPQEATVSVAVSWTAPPAPVKPVTRTIVVSRQFVGPQIVSFNLAPTNTNGDVDPLSGNPVTLTATVAAGTDRANTSKVTFSIVSASGTAATGFPLDVTTGSNGVYTTTWTPPTGTSGAYIFDATAYTSGGAPGNQWEIHANVVNNGAPAKVTNVTAVPGNTCVTLTWDSTTASDFDHYQVWRGTSSGGEVLVLDNLTANGYTDSGLSNGTKYYYEIICVDTSGNSSPPSSEVSATPVVQSDTTGPSVPGGFTAVRNTAGGYGDQALLTWTASTDAQSTIACYYIYRDGTTTPYARVPGTQLTYSDTIGYTVAHDYTVQACNSAGLCSAQTSSMHVDTATPPTYNLTVTTNKASPNTSVDVVQTDALPDPVDWGSKSFNSGASGTTNVWTAVPYGWYTVTATYNGGAPVAQSVYLKADQTVAFSF